MQSTQDVLDFLSEKTDYEKESKVDARRLNLKPISRLMESLDDPHAQFRSCHIAGSKGKGSTAEMVAAVMAYSGLRVGLYTSPHLLHLRQRIRINGRPIGEDAFVKIFEEVRDGVQEVEKAGEHPTFFDIMTAAAFTAFRASSIDVAVVETGLGGRLDSTNCVQPDVTAITSVEMDHADRLGGTLEKIAAEKAGIVKKKVPLILGPVSEKAEAVIRVKAKAAVSPVYQVGKDIVIGAVKESPEGSRFDLKTWRESRKGLTIRMLGRGQVDNAAVALGLTDAWVESGSVEVEEDDIVRGLRAARLPGRIQKVQDNPLIIVDGAHTASSAKMLREVLEGMFDYRRAFGVLAILSDKGIDSILDEIVPLCQEVVATRAPSPRSVSPEDLARRVRERFSWAIVHAEEDPGEAIKKAQSIASKDDLICITGSMYLAGEAIRIFQK